MDRAALARALAFERAIAERIAERIEPFAWGTALINLRLRNVWDANYLRVERRAPTPRALARAADETQGRAGFGHRKLSLEDADYAAGIAPYFTDNGWRVLRFIVMAHRGGVPPGTTRMVEELDPDAVRAVTEEGLREEPYGSNPETVAQLAEKRSMLPAIARARSFGVRVDGKVVSLCDLYSDGATAQIEDVATLQRYRRRGYSGAVVRKALAEAYETGHDFVFLVADDDDWPKGFYARLGFEPIGRYYSFVLPGDTM